jgi:hypothetical protein
MEVEAKYQFTTAEESVIMKGWAAGSSQQIESEEFIFGQVLPTIGTRKNGSKTNSRTLLML